MTPPLIDPRDYTLLVKDDSHKADDGTIIYGSHWNPANERGPAEKPGTVRVNVNEGSWVLEPIDNGTNTRAGPTRSSPTAAGASRRSCSTSSASGGSTSCSTCLNKQSKGSEVPTEQAGGAVGFCRAGAPP